MRFDSILVVCVGNICRSPTAERLLKQALPHKTISSAGISALAGHAADDTATAVADQNGVSLEGHVARQLTREMCQQHDLILVMEQKHMEAVSRIAPEVRGKLIPNFLNTDMVNPEQSVPVRGSLPPYLYLPPTNCMA